MRLSILIVSRTASLLNRFLASLDQACHLDPMHTEVLCSWNGSDDDEQRIKNASRYDFHIAQRTPYHFASNINGLARISNAELLMLANDDLILDPGCVDAAVATLESRTEIGLVGAVLRTAGGQLSHAGINFDVRGSAYHVLDQLVTAGDAQNEKSGPVTAVTGALQWIRRADALASPLNEHYRVCGEDIELCLDVQQHLGKQVWLCADATAIHEAESTRAQSPDQKGNSEDLLRLRSRYQAYLQAASPDQLRSMLLQQQIESQQLRRLIRERDEQWHQSAAEQAEQHRELQERHAALEQRHGALVERHHALAGRQDAMDLELRQLRHDAVAIEALQEERLRLKAMLQRPPTFAAGREAWT